MCVRAFLSLFVLLAVSLADGPGPAPAPSGTSSPAVEHTAPLNGTAVLPLDGSMVRRALYVLMGLTALVLLYFLVRLKKTTTQRKKYGLLSNYDDTVQMAHLESDDEDNTVYEARSLRR